ncbi:unnamed protein product [Fusarium graminearum]|nr:unnamed protein product [Fusarium graminearum]
MKKTKNYETVVPNFGDNTDPSSGSGTKTYQSKQDFPPELEGEPVIGHANQCITGVSKSDVAKKSP